MQTVAAVLIGLAAVIFIIGFASLANIAVKRNHGGSLTS
jgi:hypothetical protein